MTEYVIIFVLILILSIITVVSSRIARKDFSSRKFASLKSKNKWRVIVYFVPFGYLYYLKHFFNKSDEID